MKTGTEVLKKVESTDKNDKSEKWVWEKADLKDNKKGPAPK